MKKRKMSSSCELAISSASEEDDRRGRGRHSKDEVDV
jgi:hypothetical protein